MNWNGGEVNWGKSIDLIFSRFGISGWIQTAPMGTLSDGQQSRIVFCVLAFENPHILLLDEPVYFYFIHRPIIWIWNVLIV